MITCVGMLYSPIIMQSVEGEACPDATHFLMAGTQVGIPVENNLYCEDYHLRNLTTFLQFSLGKNLKIYSTKCSQQLSRI